MKAINSVPHRRLISKVHAYGIKGNVAKWLNDFLRNRSQDVVVNEVQSKEAKVTSGIPQSSILCHCFLSYISMIYHKQQSVIYIRIYSLMIQRYSLGMTIKIILKHYKMT